MPPLNNARHERFAQNLVQGESASEAYIKAGFKGDRGNASRLAASPGVRARIAELQGEAATGAKITVQSLIAELEEARQKATSLRQLSAVVRAIESKAKISGLLVQRMEIGAAGEFSDEATWEELIEDVVTKDARDFPELAGYIHYSADDRALIESLFRQLTDLTSKRLEEAKTARYKDLIANYHPRPHLTHSKTS
jgi:phage terminase small subunit